jgi:hypothetical protein
MLSPSHKRHEGHLDSHTGGACPGETLDLVVLRSCPQSLCDRLAYARFPGGRKCDLRRYLAFMSIHYHYGIRRRRKAA